MSERRRVKSKKMSEQERVEFVFGGITAVVGLYVILTGAILAGFLLLGIGIVIMASVSEEFRTEVFEFFFSIFKGIWKLLSRR